MNADIEVVSAFDIDKRKVWKDVSEAIFELPNCTAVFCKNVPKTGTKVKMGKILDGFSEHMNDYEDKYTFIMNYEKEASKAEIIKTLKESGTKTSKTEYVQSVLADKLGSGNKK